MSAAEQGAQHLMLLGAVSQMSPEDQAKVNAAREHLRAYVADLDGAGFIALTIVMSELAIKLEKGAGL